jgi:hypothetical protein
LSRKCCIPAGFSKPNSMGRARARIFTLLQLIAGL